MSGVDAARKVFISYSSKDQSYAETILQALERRGISCWYGPRDVPGGANYMRTISRAIQRAEAMVILLSRNANGSDDMKKEVALAGRRRIPIIAVRLDTISLDDDWTFEFSIRQFFDGSCGLDQIMRSLGDQVQQAIAGGVGRRPVTPPVTSIQRPLGLLSAPKLRPRVLPGRVVSLIVLAGVVITSFTLAMTLLGGHEQAVVEKAVLSAVNSAPPIVAAPQKCGYVPTYPRSSGTCR